MGYALTYKEVKMICMQRLVKVDGKTRTDMNFPTGFMDVVSLEKTNQHFRMLYDTKGRFVVHQIHKDEAAYKLCRVQRHVFGPGGNPHIVTHDGRTIRFPDPDVKANDTVLVDLASGKIMNKCKFEIGALCMIKGGNNTGRVGTITSREKHPGLVRDHPREGCGGQFLLHPPWQRHGHWRDGQGVDLAPEGQGHQADEHGGPCQAHGLRVR